MCDIAQVDHYSLDAVSFAFDLGLETLHLVAVELVFDILGFPLDIFAILLLGCPRTLGILRFADILLVGKSIDTRRLLNKLFKKGKNSRTP